MLFDLDSPSGTGADNWPSLGTHIPEWN
jgi:WD40 repeat protein